MHLVRNVSYVSEYKIMLTFEDGSVKLVDLEKHLEGEIFKPLKDLEYFRKLQLDQEIDTVVWENGADFSPDFLFDIGVERSGIAS